MVLIDQVRCQARISGWTVHESDAPGKYIVNCPSPNTGQFIHLAAGSPERKS